MGTLWIVTNSSHNLFLVYQLVNIYYKKKKIPLFYALLFVTLPTKSE